MVGTGILSNNMRSPSPECYTTFWMMTIYSDTLHWSGITPMFDPITDLDLITEFDFLPKLREVSIEHLQRMRHANRGRLLLRTPGPCPTLGLASVLMLRPISPELVLLLDFLSFEHPSVLLCLLGKYPSSNSVVKADYMFQYIDMH